MNNSVDNLLYLATNRVSNEYPKIRKINYSIDPESMNLTIVFADKWNDLSQTIVLPNFEYDPFNPDCFDGLVDIISKQIEKEGIFTEPKPIENVIGKSTLTINFKKCCNVCPYRETYVDETSGSVSTVGMSIQFNNNQTVIGCKHENVCGMYLSEVLNDVKKGV